jgi:hypothetical protein
VATWHTIIENTGFTLAVRHPPMAPLESAALGDKRLEQEELWDCLSEPLCGLSVKTALVAVPAWDLKTDGPRRGACIRGGS